VILQEQASGVLKESLWMVLAYVANIILITSEMAIIKIAMIIFWIHLTQKHELKFHSNCPFGILCAIILAIVYLVYRMILPPTVSLKNVVSSIFLFCVKISKGFVIDRPTKVYHT
jgi:hypothetical protein